MNTVVEKYETMKALVGKGQIGSGQATIVLSEIYRQCCQVLGNYDRQPLKSNVPGKTYYAFNNNDNLSRAINSNLFEAGNKYAEAFFSAISSNDFKSLPAEAITAACYSIAISFCAVIDTNKKGDQKTPGTFFEYFIGILFSRKLAVNPTKRLDILNLDKKATLPTDFIFDLGKDKIKFHVPVKTSTRERVIQVWAHQRVLDGVYGTGRFWGTLACLAETKTNKKKLEVVEICLPEQWQLYQMYIAQLKRVYYLDKPEKYAELAPKIQVKSLGDFFSEVDEWLA